MIKFFVKRPVTTLMFVLFWVILGIVSFPNLNIERTPSVDLPIVTTTLIYPGASPADIEKQVIQKVEDAVSEIAGLKKMFSQSFENFGIVMTEFNLGVDVNDKANEIKSKIDAIASNLPADVKKPIVKNFNPFQEPVMELILTGATAKDLQEYTKKTLSTKITAINGVASVNVFGGRERAIRVHLDPELMTSKGITILDVVTSLAAKNINVPSGNIDEGDKSLNIRFIGEFNSVDSIKNLQITTLEGYKFLLKDIAEIQDGEKNIETGARYNSKDVVILSVIKATDGNSIKISKELRKKLPSFVESLKKVYPTANIEIIQDSSKKVKSDTFDTLGGIAIGVLFTVLVLLFFTRNSTTTMIAGVVIPASLIAGFFFMDNFGFTINTMTLLAYSSALGTLVSNAIILIEAATNELKQGKSKQDAAIDGTKKLAVSILASVGTNVVVFLPIAFMGGIAGKFMKQFGLTVVYLTILSLMFSFTLTPMMIALFLKPTKKDLKVKPLNKESFVGRWFDFQHNKPLKVLGAFLVMFVMSLSLMKFVGNEFSPALDIDEILIIAKAPKGSTYEKTVSIAKKIEEKLGTFKEVKSYSTKIGNKGLQNITINVNLVPAYKRVSDKKLIKKMFKEMYDIPDAEIQMSPGKGMAAGGIKVDMVLYVYGDDNVKREAYAKQILDMIINTPEVQTAVLEQQEPNKEIKFIPNSDKMDFWGIKNAYAGLVLRYTIFGNDNYKYKEGGNEYPIILDIAEPFKNNDVFQNVYLNSQKGLVPLSKLGEIKNTVGERDIARINKTRVSAIHINIGKSTLSPVQKKIQKKIDTIKFESGYWAAFGGMSEIQQETVSEITKAFLLATILTFMLLAAIMNSLVHTITIATSILTSLAGSFILLFLSGASMNVAGMLAIVMLVGLVVNNNILVLEPTIARMQNDYRPKEILWEELVSKKDMILMTSIAVITGMIPQFFSTDQTKTSMAAIMMGGMFASLIFTFLLTPAIFFVIEKIFGKKKNIE